MKNVYILEGARTPFGSFGGSLKEVEVTELGTIAAKAAIERSGISADDVDQAIFGNVIHSSESAPYLARHVALKAGIPIESPALTVNRLCGSGLQAAINASQSILLDEANGVVAGGAENMSMTPHILRGLRFSTIKMGVPQFEDALISTLTDQYCGIGMGITAENLAEKYSISREEQEEFALESQQKAIEGRRSGRLSKEIVQVKGASGDQLLADDEFIRPSIDTEKMKRLKPAYKKDGSVTAATSSGINDGAAALILGNDSLIEKYGKTPLARVVSWGVSGVDPRIMGIGPVTSTRQALKRAGLEMKDIDLIEINEAFAVQVLSVQKELGFDMKKLNVNGGAIALGHPVGASGARILLTLAYELREQGKRYGVASLCCGGGQGVSMIIENMEY